MKFNILRHSPLVLTFALLSGAFVVSFGEALAGDNQATDNSAQAASATTTQSPKASVLDDNQAEEAPQNPNPLPIKTVREIQKSIDSANLDAFMNRVDLDALIYQGTDLFLQRLPGLSDKMAEKGIFPPMLALASSAAKKGVSSMEYQSVRTFIASAAKQFIKDGVDSGAFAGKKKSSGNAMPNALPDKLFSSVPNGRKELAYPRVTSEKLNKSVVETMFKDYGSGQVYRLLLEVIETPDGWRVKRIANLNEVFNSLERDFDLR